jgi:muconolactone D-isomerase
MTGENMLFKVDMTVNIPLGYPAAERRKLNNAKKPIRNNYSVKAWRHIWRVAGLYANVSIFDVRDAEELHQILMGLPLYPLWKSAWRPCAVIPPRFVKTIANNNKNLAPDSRRKP